MSNHLSAEDWMANLGNGFTAESPSHVRPFVQPAMTAQPSTVHVPDADDVAVINQTDTGMNAEAFNKRALPNAGRYCLVEAGRGMRHTWYETQEGLTAATRRLSQTPDLYFGTMAYDAMEKRKQANVVAGRALRLDIDAGPEKYAKHGDKVYPDVTAALAAVAGFERQTGLVASLIVKSGNGLHLYYTFAEDMQVSDWLSAANLLKRITDRCGLRVDPSVTTDSARILRPVGSLHNNGNRVHVIRERGDITLEDLNRCAERVEVNDSTTARLPAPGIGKATAELGSFDAQNEPSGEAVMAACPTVAMAAKTGCAGYDTWLPMLTIAAHTCDPDNTAEMLFGAYSDALDPVAESLEKMATLTGGPARCDKIAEQVPGAKCGECQYRGRATTPIHAAQISLRSAGEKAGLKTLPPEIAEPMRRVNEKYLIAPIGGECMIHVEYTDPETGKPGLKQVSEHALRLEYANKSVPVQQQDGRIKAVNLATYWKQSPHRREYREMGFRFDGQAPAGFYNLYRGLAVEPNPASAERFDQLLHDVVGGDQEQAKYLLRWLAFSVQRPGDRTETVVVFRGAEGVGKGTVARLMTAIFGPHALHLANGRHLTGNFNAHLRLALFLFVDEGYWAGDPAAEGVLKQLITEDQIMIEQKGVDAFMAPNRLKLMMATNNAWAVPAGPTSRRFFVVDVPDTNRGNTAYWTSLNKWLDGEGRGAALNHLLSLDLSNFDIRNIPHTAALDDQKRLSLPPFMKWLEDRLDEGCLWDGTGWDTEAPCQRVVESYAAYCAAHGRRHEPTTGKSVGLSLAKVFGPVTRKRTSGGNRHGVWIVPALDEARKLFCKHVGIESQEWSDE